MERPFFLHKMLKRKRMFAVFGENLYICGGNELVFKRACLLEKLIIKCNDMNTLNINTELLQQAEMQAKMYNLNLNQIVESFIRKFIKNPRGVEQIEIKTTPFVERLGVDLDLPADFDEKKAYRNYLSEKHL